MMEIGYKESKQRGSREINGCNGSAFQKGVLRAKRKEKKLEKSNCKKKKKIIILTCGIFSNNKKIISCNTFYNFKKTTEWFNLS